ncbi:glycosyltransferase family 4 protein [Halovivax sp.]|uniref:glycosyltransferase family 4 protein n=1 Tax=Halovivax sp. TaxID=1935978 RepID=UPI0025C2AB03|nr:glycosyltransferase family 4 protein [Halovivax sp.]
MHVLRVAQKVYPDVEGGLPYHVHAMSRDQAAMGHDVTVLTVRQDPSPPKTETRDGYRLVRFDPRANLIGNQIAPGLARRLLKTDGFDVVHAHSHIYFATNLAAAIARYRDLPLAITNHGMYSQSVSKRVFSVYLKTLGRWTFNQADVVFCYTEGGRERTERIGVTAPIDVVANGIDETRFTPDGRESDALGGEGPTVLAVLRLKDGKRPADAIEVIDRVRDRHPTAGLYLAGDGPLRERLERTVARRGLEDAVTFLGSVPYDEMPALYRACDAIVHPSEAEGGSPRVILEAMAAGRPFVATDLEHFSPSIADVGRMRPVGHVDGMAEDLTELLSDPNRRRRLGERGRRLVESAFSWRSTVEGTTETLERLCESADWPRTAARPPGQR